MDIATDKLWISILFLLKADYSSALFTINKLLSSIPPYAVYFNHDMKRHEFHVLFVDMFSHSDLFEAAKRAWVFNLCVFKCGMSVFPTAIQSSYDCVKISPFTLAHYLQFLCYHNLRQYENRNHALRQLVEVVQNNKQNGCACIRVLGYEIAGHCLWYVGEIARATEMFQKVSEIKINRRGQ